MFQLLETIYCAFDAIAKRRRVFKVETIGDSYVAVVGLPSPRDHHAVAMARFAKDIRQKMGLLMAELVTSLGHVSIWEQFAVSKADLSHHASKSNRIRRSWPYGSVRTRITRFAFTRATLSLALTTLRYRAQLWTDDSGRIAWRKVAISTLW